MTTKTKNTQPQTLAKYMINTGRYVSANQAQKMFGIRNVRACISTIRKEHSVETSTNKSGVTVYRIARV